MHCANNVWPCPLRWTQVLFLGRLDREARIGHQRRNFPADYISFMAIHRPNLITCINNPSNNPSRGNNPISSRTPTLRFFPLKLLFTAKRKRGVDLFRVINLVRWLSIGHYGHICARQLLQSLIVRTRKRADRSIATQRIWPHPYTKYLFKLPN